MEAQQDRTDVRGMLRRRRKTLVYTFLLIFLSGALTAWFLPPVYRSESTILIEEQQIPPDYVKSTITSYVEERLQTINQQILSRPRLMEIISRFDLYSEMRQRTTLSKVIEKMREDIHLETISAEVIDKRTGRPGTATIAFTLSYDGEDPGTVQKVANVLSSLYLEEDLKTRERLASTTTIFFQEELDSIKEKMRFLEERISEFKRDHLGELPENQGMNMQRLSRLEQKLEQLNIKLLMLQEKKIYLEGQIAKVDPMLPVVSSDGQKILKPAEHLRQLKLQLLELRSALTDKHPDVTRIKRQIVQMEEKTGQIDVKAAGDTEETLAGKLAVLRTKLGSRHPDVIMMSRRLEMAKQGNAVRQAEGNTYEHPDNPAYITLVTQISSADMEIKSLYAEKQKLSQQIESHRRMIESTPFVEKEYNELKRDYDSATHKYNDILAKLMEARVAQGMEESQRGERFTITDPAHLPEKPYKPNRLGILILSFMAAAGAAVALAGLQENMDLTVKSSTDLKSLTTVPVLSVIGRMESAYERKIRRIRRIAWGAGGMVAIMAACVIIHVYIMPLEILWIHIQRKMNMMSFI